MYDHESVEFPFETIYRKLLKPFQLNNENTNLIKESIDFKKKLEKVGVKLPNNFPICYYHKSHKQFVYYPYLKVDISKIKTSRLTKAKTGWLTPVYEKFEEHAQRYSDKLLAEKWRIQNPFPLQGSTFVGINNLLSKMGCPETSLQKRANELLALYEKIDTRHYKLIKCTTLEDYSKMFQRGPTSCMSWSPSAPKYSSYKNLQVADKGRYHFYHGTGLYPTVWYYHCPQAQGYYVTDEKGNVQGRVTVYKKYSDKKFTSYGRVRGKTEAVRAYITQTMLKLGYKQRTCNSIPIKAFKVPFYKYKKAKNEEALKNYYIPTVYSDDMRARVILIADMKNKVCWFVDENKTATLKLKWEKDRYRYHKISGWYVSDNVLNISYFQYLSKAGFDSLKLGAGK